MRVRGSVNPGTFSVEVIPKKRGWCLCRFFQNAQKYSETVDGETVEGWEYDEYHLELPDSGCLEQDIEGNFDVFLNSAIATEAPTELERLRADTDFLLAIGGYL